ncbi:Imm45 family immunity protein [Erwinia sp. Eh17-17]|uniref:Imm45 family immunity protein n=1 Tax=Erwinia sp. Eh17-17 TaxID=3080330 RepID=UPI003208F564
MMEYIKLVNYPGKSIRRGRIFRLPAVWPYENIVDFMVIDMAHTHGLVVSSGFKAGSMLIELPLESASTEGHALSTEWIINNWAKWIYPECAVEDVYIIDQYTAMPIE